MFYPHHAISNEEKTKITIKYSTISNLCNPESACLVKPTFFLEAKKEPPKIVRKGANGWCTDLVKGTRKDITWTGDAHTYLAQAKANGFDIGDEPEVGAVIQTNESYWGHVAIVKSVKENTIVIVEQNVKGYGIQSQRELKKTDHRILGYIL